MIGLLLLLLPALLPATAQGPADPSATVPREIRRHRVGIAFEVGATPEGLRVQRLVPGEPGEQAGLLPGDVLLEVGGVAATEISSQNLAEHFSRSTPIVVSVRRGDVTFESTLSPQPAPLAEREVVGAALDPRQRVPIFEATLAGRSMRLLLHTGTQRSSLTPRAFGRLGRAQPSEGQAVHVGPLRIDHLEFTGRAFAMEEVALPGLEYDGVLALPDLAPFLVRIDYADHELVVESGTLPPADGGEVLDYFVCGETGPAVSVDVAGWDFDMHLDSSLAAGISIAGEYAAELATAAPPAVLGRVGTGAEWHDLLGAELAGSVRIGRHELESPGVRFSSAFDHANLGPDALNEFALTFDVVHERVRFQRRATFLETLLAGAAAAPSLEVGGVALGPAFQRDRGRPRLLLLLSPT